MSMGTQGTQDSCFLDQLCPYTKPVLNRLQDFLCLLSRRLAPLLQSGSRVQLLYLESISHTLAKPDMLLFLGVCADVPVLLGHRGLSGEHTGLACLHVAEDLDGIQVAALVRVNPVLS